MGIRANKKQKNNGPNAWEHVVTATLYGLSRPDFAQGYKARAIKSGLVAIAEAMKPAPALVASEAEKALPVEEVPAKAEKAEKLAGVVLAAGFPREWCRYGLLDSMSHAEAAAFYAAVKSGELEIRRHHETLSTLEALGRGEGDVIRIIDSFQAYKEYAYEQAEAARHTEDLAAVGEDYLLIGQDRIPASKVSPFVDFVLAQSKYDWDAESAVLGLQNIARGRVVGKNKEGRTQAIKNVWDRYQSQLSHMKAAIEAAEALANMRASYPALSFVRDDRMYEAVASYQKIKASLEKANLENSHKLERAPHYDWGRFGINPAVHIKLDSLGGKSICQYLMQDAEWLSARRAGAVDTNLAWIERNGGFLDVIDLLDISQFDGGEWGKIPVYVATMLPAQKHTKCVEVEPWGPVSFSEQDDVYYQEVVSYSPIKDASPRWDLIGK